MPTFLFSGSNGQSNLGRTKMITDLHTQGTMSLIGSDPKLGWQTHRSIITRMTVGFQGNYQFLHTLGNDIYIYVFGDRMGQLSVSGLSMAADCDNPGASDHGFELVMQWYAQNRVASRQAPVIISIGRTTIEGFVVGLQGEAADTANRLVQYSMQLVVLPEKTSQPQNTNSDSGTASGPDSANDPATAFANEHEGLNHVDPQTGINWYNDGATYNPLTGHLSTDPFDVNKPAPPPSEDEIAAFAEFNAAVQAGN